MSNDRVLDPGVWAGATPPAGPFGAPENLGYWFELDEAGWLTGFRQYSDGRFPNFVLFQVWTESGDLIAQSTRSIAELSRNPGGAGWRNVWLHPRCPLAATTPYLLAASLTEFWAHFGALVGAPTVSSHITVYEYGTFPESGNGVYDSVTDSNGYFSFVNPPHDPVVGHLYGIDLLIEFPL